MSNPAAVPSGRVLRALFRKPPWTAVRALFRSMGYTVAKYQRARWSQAARDGWCPLTVYKNDVAVTRWLHWPAGQKPRVSDGRHVPRKRLIAYAAKRTAAIARMRAA